MNTADKKISEVLAKFGEPMAGNVWRVQGTAVIYHKTLERIAAEAKIRFDEPKIIRAERDECVIQLSGHMGDRTEWTIGEACLFDPNRPSHSGNYRVSGKQAAYPYAIAEKRAKDRVILKLIELHGHLYSEEESDEFRRSNARDEAEREVERPDDDPRMDEPEQEIERAGKAIGGKPSPEDQLKAKIKAGKTINAITDLMLHADTQKVLEAMAEEIRDEIRDFAKARLVELGWPVKQDRAREEEPEPAIRKSPEDRQPPQDPGLESDKPKPYDREESLKHGNELVKGLRSIKTQAQLSAWARESQSTRKRLLSADNERVIGQYNKVKEGLKS